MKTIQGIAASPGIAIGPVTRLGEEERKFRRTVAAGEATREKERFAAARQKAKAELEALQERAAGAYGAEKGEVFAAQQLMLEDPLLVDAVNAAIAGRAASAEAAVETAVRAAADMLAGLDDEYLRERAADVRDIGRRLTRILQGTETRAAAAGILAARELLPSDTACLDLAAVRGFVTALGGRTSHSSILARAAGIPAVVGVGGSLDFLRDGETVIIDGHAGIILLEPGQAELDEYRRRQEQERRRQDGLAAAAALAGVTADGWRVEVAANIGTPADMSRAAAAGAEGVGLFRTEFLFLERDRVPGEDEQYEAYRQVLAAMPDKRVVIRTLDAGGDKQLPFLSGPAEANPALGLRAIRLCMAHRAVFKTQLRALLRAGTAGQLHIMFPMIATLEELLDAKALLREAAAELAGEGVGHRADVPVGIMVEVPAAALSAGELIREADFLSIGTNDLVQYTMASDRMNEHVAYLNDYFQPPVLRLVAGVARAAEAGGKWAGMCGEMAGDPLATPLLVGLGLTELSMNSRAVPGVKAIVRRLRRDRAAAWAEEALKLPTAGEVRRYLETVAAELGG